MEELKNSFPDMPAWIAQHYLTQFEHQVSFSLDIFIIYRQKSKSIVFVSLFGTSNPQRLEKISKSGRKSEP